VVNILPKKEPQGVELDFSRKENETKKIVYQNPKMKDYQVKMNMSVSEMYNHRPVIQNKN
jgi:hypothetical protein